jgi:hypothetical protein
MMKALKAIKAGDMDKVFPWYKVKSTSSGLRKKRYPKAIRMRVKMMKWIRENIAVSFYLW